VLAEPGSARGLKVLGLVAPLVGRTDELDQLVAAFGRMQRGRAQVVSLVGEAGTGKSRLIAELLARLDGAGQLAGTAIRRAACSSLGEPTYGVFGALFREAYEVDPADSLDVARQKLEDGLRALDARDEEARAIAPVLSYVLGLEDEVQPRDVEPEQLQRQIVLAARTLVERRLQQEPLLILVEDLHWADAASVDLLRHVVDHLADRPPATPEFMQEMVSVRINPTGELPEPLPIPEAAEAIGRLDGYAATKTDRADMRQQWPQLRGQFLIDLDGIVRWANVECGAEGLAGAGKFPSEEEILTAARALPRR
jgi:hypothetical protein